MKRNLLRQIKGIIYRLKREYGLPIIVYHRIFTDTDRKTGVITERFQTLCIRRAAVLPNRRIRDFAYDLSYIAANKNFTYGAFFDPEDRIIIIDKDDLKNIPLKIDDFIIFQEKQYEVKEIREAELDQGMIVLLKAIEKARPPFRLVKQVLHLVQTATAVIT